MASPGNIGITVVNGSMRVNSVVWPLIRARYEPGGKCEDFETASAIFRARRRSTKDPSAAMAKFAFLLPGGPRSNNPHSAENYGGR